MCHYQFWYQSLLLLTDILFVIKFWSIKNVTIPSRYRLCCCNDKLGNSIYCNPGILMNCFFIQNIYQWHHNINWYWCSYFYITESCLSKATLFDEPFGSKATGWCFSRLTLKGPQKQLIMVSKIYICCRMSDLKRK